MKPIVYDIKTRTPAEAEANIFTPVVSAAWSKRRLFYVAPLLTVPIAPESMACLFYGLNRRFVKQLGLF
jgi:hypothetical protein